MRKLLLIILFVGIQSVALADWTVSKQVDAMTDEVKKTAIVKNELGHTFSIYRISPGGAVWGNFALSDGVFDQVDWRKPPIYRVDKNKPNDLAKEKEVQDMGVGIHAYEWEPKWVNFLIWHGKENEGIADNLIQLMEGERVVFRYYLSTGGYKDTSFTLKGASSAIAEAIGINEKIEHAAQQKADEFKRAYMAGSKRCRNNMSTFKECFSKVNDCRKQAGRDVHVSIDSQVSGCFGN